MSFNMTDIEQVVSELQPKFIYIDYIQKIDGEAKEIGAQITKIARKYNAVIIAACQLDKGFGSDCVEDAASYVSGSQMFVKEAAGIIAITKPTNRSLNLYCIKNRFGPLGFTPCEYTFSGIRGLATLTVDGTKIEGGINKIILLCGIANNIINQTLNLNYEMIAVENDLTQHLVTEDSNTVRIIKDLYQSYLCREILHDRKPQGERLVEEIEKT